MPDAPPLDRFYPKVMRRNGCLEWIAGRSHGGYGRFQLNGVNRYAHRVIWELEIGPIPEGIQVLHWCDNPPCVWIPHLFLGTHQDNIDDKMRKGRYRRIVGEQQSNAKLTWEKVDSIRRRWSQGNVTQMEMAAEYGVNNSIICEIVHNKRWIQ